MALAENWTNFIRIHGGEPGARDMFEKAMGELLKAENPEKEVHIIEASQGDGGIDIYVRHEEGGIDIYQCKFYMDKMTSGRWQKIKESFDSAMKSNKAKVMHWYLCMPREFRKEDIDKIDKFIKERATDNVAISFIDGNEIINRMQKTDASLVEKYFSIPTKKQFTNKDLIAPLTDSKSNVAQGGTYVRRDELLVKIANSYESQNGGKRIVILTGIGGCGKSELARAFANEHREEYEEIFWLTCTDGVKPRLREIMSDAQTLCEVSAKDIKAFSEDVLIIVDNCNIENEPFLNELERGTGKADVLVTTRLGYLGNYESIISVEEDKPESFAYAVFEKNYCRKPRWGCAKDITENEKNAVITICETILYNTMIVSLIAIRLREYSDLTIMECADKISSGVGSIIGIVNYSKDLNSRSEEMKEILDFLYTDILNYTFSFEQKAILSVLAFSPASWCEREYLFSLLDPKREKTEYDYATNTLLNYGWLQGNEERVTVHPLIAEVISHRSILIPNPAFYGSLLLNYLGMPDKYLGKEKFVVNKILNKSDVAEEVKIAVMLLINHNGYIKSFSERFTKTNLAYFVYINCLGKRRFFYYDLEKSESHILVEASGKIEEGDSVILLKIYNRGLSYTLDLNKDFQNKKIKEVPAGLCYRDKNINSLILPDTITIINEAAFMYSGISNHNLDFPNSLTIIGDAAFWGCKELGGELKLPVSLKSIGSAAFYECSGLSGQLELPEKLERIGKSAFYNCSKLSGNFSLPKNLISIGDHAFYGCSGLIGKIELPSSLESFGKDVFWGCDGLTGELKLQSSQKNNEDTAKAPVNKVDKKTISRKSSVSTKAAKFSDNRNLRGTLSLPNDLTTIKDYEYWQCKNLNGRLVFPPNLTSIGNGAFSCCDGFSGDLKFPEGLKSIGNHAFFLCSGFDGILEFPASLIHLGNYAFSSCSSLSGDLELPKGLKSIGLASFSGCESLRGKLSLPESIHCIKDDAFINCSGLGGELKLPESLVRIGSGAFSECAGLTGKLEIPDGITNIEAYTFYRCSGLDGELKLPKGTKSIGDHAFFGCSGLSGKLKLPEGLLTIEYSAFEGCKSLSGELNLPSSLLSIGALAFAVCSGFSGELVLQEGITDIGRAAFIYCSGLSGKLVLPASLTRIGESAFAGCNKIEKIVVNNRNLEIENAFDPFISAVICGYKHSTAENYANEYGLVFEEIKTSDN